MAPTTLWVTLCADPAAATAKARPCTTFILFAPLKLENQETMTIKRPQTAGRIHFVGAGPGNPDLLTLRARTVLENTAVAYTDDAVLPEVRHFVGLELPVPQEKIDAADAAYEEAVAEAKAKGARRKPPRPAAPTAGEIREPLTDATAMAKELIAAAATGDDIVRLIAGNPLSETHAIAEIQAVSAAGAEFNVVPGMPMAPTIPAFAGIALGDTFTEANVAVGEADWDSLATAPLPLVLTAALEDFPAISKELLARDLDGQLPVTVTTNGTTRRQRSHDVTLQALAKLNVETGGDVVSGDVIVTIGAPASSRKDFAWWESRALYGWNVLVPRAKSQAASMSKRLTAHGAIPAEVPTISVEPPRSPAQMERAIKGIVDGRYQWVVFTSVNAVQAVWDKMTEYGLDSRGFAGLRVAAVGHKTAQAIKNLGIVPELLPRYNEQNAQGLVDVFPEYCEEIDPVDRVLLPRADIATDVLVDGLIELGWDVEDITAYRTVRAAPPSADIRERIKGGGFDAVCFTSSSTVRNLVGIAGKPHQRTIIACIGPMTADTAREYGLRVDVMPERAGIEELVDALADHVSELRAKGELPPPRKRRRRSRKTTAAVEAQGA